MGTRSGVMRSIGVFLALLTCTLLFQLWRGRYWLAPSEDSPQKTNQDVNEPEISIGKSQIFTETPAVQKNGRDTQGAHFYPNNSLTFGHGAAVKSPSRIMKSPWVSTLRNLLNKKFQLQQQMSQRKQVTIVVSNTNYTLSLLNWLVAALIKTSPPLEIVIIVSLDKTLQALLERKAIVSVYINPETVTSGEMQTKASHIWITRCAVYRLLNRWGYDVMAYDTDATVIKNLQPILDAHPNSDIVASAGSYPFQLGRKWGLTLCMGVILIRSTKNTELLWNSMSRTRVDTQDDQVKINYALDSCNIEWLGTGRSIENQAISGKCRLNGLTVTVLPRSLVCRNCMQYRNSYYVWHARSKRAGDMKKKTAISGFTWHLGELTVKEDGALKESGWTEKLKGRAWLKAIAVTG